MFCPKCKAEYRKGFYVCSDCRIQLVDELQNKEVDKIGIKFNLISLANYKRSALNGSVIWGILSFIMTITYLVKVGQVTQFRSIHFLFSGILCDLMSIFINSNQAYAFLAFFGFIIIDSLIGIPFGLICWKIYILTKSKIVYFFILFFTFIIYWFAFVI